MCVCVCVFAVLPDNGGHDLCSKEDTEWGGGLRGEQSQNWENCDSCLTEVWWKKGGEKKEILSGQQPAANSTGRL